MRAVAVKANSEIAVMTENTKPIWETLLSQPSVKSFAFANLLAMLCPAAVNMVNGEKFNSVFTAARAFTAIVIYESLTLFSLLVANSGIRLFPVVSRPSVFDFKVFSVFFGNLFWIRILPGFMNLFIACLAGNSKLVVSSRIPRKHFNGNVSLAPITNPGSRNIAGSIFGWPSILFQGFLRFAVSIN